MNNTSQHDWAHDLVLPTLLFAALGAMNWAVRGCRGFGGVAGCIFAGVTWGAAWWYIAHDPRREQSRRYASGWIVLALTVGIGLAGGRGWRQWSTFFEGRLQTDTAKGEYVPISRSYGFLWLFIAGVPWAGLGACLLAWCGSIRETRVWHWVIRIACGVGGAALARYLFDTYPQYFLPLYQSLEARYHDLGANPNVRRLINDCGLAVAHLGYYLGFLLYEAGRRDGKNVVLILTVGLVNGAGWALCQNWMWAPGVWQGTDFAWWRCWESSGGISIGLAYGLAYFLVNRRMSDEERAVVATRRSLAGPNFEWLLIYGGLAWFLSLFIRNQMGGWGNIYFSVVILWGAAYYFLYRGTAADEVPHRTRWAEVGANIEWGAVCLTAALIAGLFIPERVMMRYLVQAADRVKQSSGFSIPTRALMRPGLVYLEIVLAVGIAWYLIRRRAFEEEKRRGTPADGDPNIERLGLYLGLLLGLGLSIRSGWRSWMMTYRGDGNFESRVLWQYLGPVYLACLIALAAWVLLRPLPRNYRGPVFPHAYGLMWLVLIVQNVIAQLITGPLSHWNEMAFSIYYLPLFFITAIVVFHFHVLKKIIPMPSGPTT